MLTAIVSLAVFWVIHCTAPVEVVDGGASGTDVGFCKVLGAVTDTLGQPIAGGLVRLRPFDYIVGREEEDVVKRDVYSDVEGCFIIDSVPVGHYTVECLSPDSLGETVDCVIDSLDTVAVLPSATLRPMASIIGNSVGEKVQGEADRSVQVIGLERSTPIDNEGDFRLTVPWGWCRLNLHGIDPDNADIDTMMYLRPGENKKIGLPPRHAPQCDSLACELMEVRGILDSNGLQSIAPESVVVIAGDHVVELHLRGLGIRTLPPSVSMITRLRVIDVGNNNLRELPHSFKLFYRLEELIADGNELWMIDASIGMVKSLRVLDLSFNLLQTLPEPITYLSLTYLDLSGNMLCNIGELTRKWIDANDPDWKETQVCQ
jgi:hypothetical protein